MAALAQHLPALVPSVTPEQLADIRRAAAQVVEMLPPPDYGQVEFEAMDLQLVLRHDCE
jgi:hypothetical protein